MAKKTSPKDRAGRQARTAPKSNKRVGGADEARPARAPEHQAAERETRTTYSEG
ncbi:hypothetical protein ACFWV1_04620 [Streptomyces sp. NPDC058700]|uniref:hypothetical protein n=1 Tax=unclassified Streptomyces TaxID=2593676 RepID=UPI00364C6B0F